MAHDVFISYSTKDKTIAEVMCATLESKGIRCWIAPRDIVPGRDWTESIIDAIASSRVMVLLFSSNSNESPDVKREVDSAVNEQIIIIPFRIENVSLSKSLQYYLRTTHWLDALTPPIEKHLQTLVEKVRQLLFVNSDTGNISAPHATFEIPEAKAPKQSYLSIFWLFLNIAPSLSKQAKIKRIKRRVFGGGIAGLIIGIVFIVAERDSYPVRNADHVLELIGTVLSAVFLGIMLGVIIPAIGHWIRWLKRKVDDL